MGLVCLSWTSLHVFCGWRSVLFCHFEGKYPAFCMVPNQNHETKVFCLIFEKKLHLNPISNLCNHVGNLCSWNYSFTYPSQTRSKTVSKLAHPNAPLGYALCFLNAAFDGFTNATQVSISAMYNIVNSTFFIFFHKCVMVFENLTSFLIWIYLWAALYTYQNIFEVLYIL